VRNVAVQLAAVFLRIRNDQRSILGPVIGYPAIFVVSLSRPGGFQDHVSDCTKSDHFGCFLIHYQPVTRHCSIQARDVNFTCISTKLILNTTPDLAIPYLLCHICKLLALLLRFILHFRKAVLIWTQSQSTSHM
jgi:hypothetical protein